jgi:hypothetical protein
MLAPLAPGIAPNNQFAREIYPWVTRRTAKIACIAIRLLSTLLNWAPKAAKSLPFFQLLHISEA